MRIAFTTLACPDWSLETILERAVRYGYEGVDFRGLGETMDITALRAFTTDLDETCRRISDAGLVVPALSTGAKMFSPDSAGRQNSLDEVARYAELAQQMQAPMIRVFGGALGGADPDEAIASAGETLVEMCRQAGPITVAVETHDDWVRSDLLVQPIAAAAREADNLCVCWDLHHPYRLAGESPAETFTRLGPYVGYTHVKDSRVGPEGKAELVLPGEGDVPLAEMVQLLAGGGYDGWLTLEWEKRWHPEIASADAALAAWAPFLRSLA